MYVDEDSFFWGLAIYYNLWTNFTSFTFCDYYKTIYRAGYSTTTSVSNFNLKDEIKKDTIFIIEATEPNMSNLGWGFVDSAYNILNHDTIFEQVVLMRSKIRTDSAWMKSISEKAKTWHIPVDSMLTLDALWMIQRQNN